MKDTNSSSAPMFAEEVKDENEKDAVYTTLCVG